MQLKKNWSVNSLKKKKSCFLVSLVVYLDLSHWISFLQKIECLHNNAVMELMRGVRSQLTELIAGLAVQDLAPMSLGLSHSLSRYKLKFSPDKVSSLSFMATNI